MKPLAFGDETLGILKPGKFQFRDWIFSHLFRDETLQNLGLQRSDLRFWNLAALQPEAKSGLRIIAFDS